MLPSRSLWRAVWKGPFFTPLPAQEGSEGVKTMARSCTILPSHVGRKFMVHNGKAFVQVIVNEQMVNHKLGEFAHTRKEWKFKKKDK